MQIIVNVQYKQRDHDYIESRFQEIMNEWYYSNIQNFSAPYPFAQPVPHILASTEVYFSSPDKSLLEILMRKCMHWNFSYIWERGNLFQVEYDRFYFMNKKREERITNYYDESLSEEPMIWLCLKTSSEMGIGS